MTAAGRDSDAIRIGSRPQALGYVLALLLATLSLCLGAMAERGEHAPAGAAPTSGAASAAVKVPVGPAVQSPVLRNNCPEGDTCCAPAVRITPAVRPGEAHPVPAILPELPRPPGVVAPRSTVRPSDGHHTPDLHLLQVLRT